jgi:hypothetical protein
MRFALDTIASPEQVRVALTDFSERRLRIWQRTLDPKRYQLRDEGDDWAVAREATAGSPFWVVSRYDWSEPGIVRWTVVESSYGGGGEGVVTITPNGGGSHLDVQWDYADSRPLQRPLLFLLHRGPMNRLIARMWRQALDRFAQDG